MSSLEAAGAILGLIAVFLVIRRSVWNYPFGLAMVAIYGFVFHDAKLYSDMLLQGFFFVVQAYGWWHWTRGLSRLDEPIAPETLNAGQRFIAVALTASLAAGLGTFMATATDAALPYWDAAVTAGSVVGQVLLARKKIESWLFWIGVDTLAIGVFAVKELYVTAGLYVVFLAMAVWGWIAWRRVLAAQDESIARP